MQAFVGLLHAIVSSWTRGWCSSIVATDASEYGFSVCLKECKKDVCEVIGRTSERARFRERHLDTPGERTTFFDQHRLGFDSRGDLIDLVENDDVTAEMMLVLVDNFLVVPLEVVEASGWMDVASGRWRYRKENVKLASLFFALDPEVTVRWVPSETNVSDWPSRIHDPSDIRGKTMTDLLATVVQERTHRDEMMAQRDPTKTSSMIQGQLQSLAESGKPTLANLSVLGGGQ